MSEILTGRVIRAGTLPIADDQAFDGIVVEIPRDQLANFPHRIVYADVCVTLQSRQESQVDAMAEVARLTRERDELQAWKDSAMAVEREWNPNTLATMLGGRLGEAQRVVIQREVPKLLDRVKRLEEELEAHSFDLSPAMVQARNDQLNAENEKLRAKVEKLKVWGDALEDLAPQPPERNCSCHICPPCSDCVDWSQIREAKENWREAKEAHP